MSKRLHRFAPAILALTLIISQPVTGHAASTDPSWVAFTDGDPMVPGDGSSVSVLSGNFFALSQPFDLATATDGITITAYPSQDSNVVFDGPEDFVSVIFTDKTAGHTSGTGFAFSGSTVFNGVTGAVFNIPQWILSFVAQQLNIVWGTTITAADLEVTSFAVGIDYGVLFVKTLDAAAIGLGQNAVPTVPQLTALSPAKLWVGLKNSDDVGLRVDLLAKVFLDTEKVGEGMLTNVSIGSSGFNNAILRSIPLALTDGPVAVPVLKLPRFGGR